MPVYLERRSRGRRPSGPSRTVAAASLPASPTQTLSIGLVNNMAGSAFRATERQFVSLLNSASGDISIRLSLYALPGVPSADSGPSHIGGRYVSTETLGEGQLDGLIVTGREPMASDLRDEPYWESFTRLLDWAAQSTHSAIYSCLAAHAAVLHLDNISRRKLERKYFGIFECAQACGHPLTAELPQTFPVPHSRWNSVAEEDLSACGYTILSRSGDEEVDAFFKLRGSLFVFLQGHPEYEPDTLLREYRRDIGRYLRYQMNAWPSLPIGYFNGEIEGALAVLREEAGSRRSKDLLAGVASILEIKPEESRWHAAAARFYRNWLVYLCDRKNA